MDTERVLTSAPFKFPEENNFIIHLLNRYVIILNTLKGFLHFVQFMVVSSKKCTCLCLRMLVDILYNSPSYGYSVVSRSSASQFIEQDKASGRNIIQNIRRFIHLDHKSRFSYRDIVTGTDPSKNLIYQSDMSAFGRNERTNLGKQGDQCSLP